MLLADDTPRKTENNIPYDIEFLDGVFTHLAIVNNPRYERANIVFNSKTAVKNKSHNAQVFEQLFQEAIDEVLREIGQDA